MARPSDWFLVGLDQDPTPGDGFGIRQVAQKYSDIAYVAANAASLVRGMRSSGASEAWVGDAGEVFRSETDRMPGELSKADDSYSMVAAALSGWAAAVEDAQAQADRGLALARDAHTDLLTAQSVYDHAHTSWSVAHAQQLTQQKLQKQYQNVPPPSGVTVPSDAQLRATTRTVLQARTSMDAAQTEIASATARLDAAKRLVLEAKAARDEAEHRTVTRIGDAMANAVKPSSVWEAIQDSAEWQAIVVIATVVLTIVSIVAIFVGGPLVWAIIAATTVLLMVNALLSIAQGKNAWLELGLLALGLIPGGRALTSVAELAAAFRTGATVGRGLIAVGGHLASVSKSAILDMVRALPRTAIELKAGTTSVVRSIPNAIKNADPTSGFIARAHEIASTLKRDFDQGAEWGLEAHFIKAGHTNPSAAASGWQHGGAYPHPDAWHNGLAQTGDIFEAGAGGPVSGFTLERGTTAALGHDMNAIWEGAQVGADSTRGYRGQMYLLEVTSDVPVAHSIVEANPHFGAGGLHQTYFPDITANIQNGQVAIISAATHLPIQPTYTEVRNSAGDVLHVEAWVKLGERDMMILHGVSHNPDFPSKQEAAGMFTVVAPYAPALGAAGNAASGVVRVRGALNQGED